MSKKNKNLQIEEVVLKNFIRVIKDKNLYVSFLVNTNPGGVVGYILRKHKTSNDNPFKQCKTKDGIVKKLSELTSQMSSHMGRNCSDEESRITMNINHLLHFFLEKRPGMTMNSLSEIGEDIFNMSCKDIFNDEYDYILSSNEKHIQNFERMNNDEFMMFMSHAFSDYMRNYGGSDKVVNIENFISKEFGDEALKRFVELNTLKDSRKKTNARNGFIDSLMDGIALGPGPDRRGDGHDLWFEDDREVFDYDEDEYEDNDDWLFGDEDNDDDDY